MGGYFLPPPYQEDNMENLLQQRAQIQARGAQQSGQIWGNAFQNVGQIAGQAVQQYGEQRDQKKIQGAVSAGMANPDDFDSVLSSLDPTQAARARKAFADANDAASKLDERKSLIAQHEAALQKAHADYQQQTADYAGTVALRTLPFLDDDPAGGIGAISMALAHAKSRGVPGADQFDQQLASAQDLIKKAQESGDPMAVPAAGEKIRQTFKPILEQMTLGMSPETKAKLLGEEPKAVALSDNQRLVDPRTGRVIVEGTPKEERRSIDVQLAAASAAGDTANYNRLLKVKKDAGQADDRPRVVVTGGGASGAVDPSAIADAIMNGDQPPEMTGLYRNGAAVRTMLAKKGFNLAAAQTDWKATQRHVASMNGPTQLKLQQSINALPELLDSVDSIAKEWKGGQFPILNKANLALAKGGAYGPEVASVATRLDQQIADVTSDLGSVYMGGNSPTDHSLKLAETALKGDWDERVFHDMVKMARANVQIRRNSVLHSGVAGVGDNNPYAPQQGAPYGAPPPSGPPTAGVHIKTDAEYNALPSGTVYTGPDGQVRTKR